MKKVYVVEMNDSQKPLFPDSCVVCRQPKGEPLGTMIMPAEYDRVDFYMWFNFK